jgi:5,10-methylenetetrahydromethanopterin reductase
VSVAFGVAFDGLSPLSAAVDLGRRAEAAGLRTMWMAEHMGYREATLGAMAVLTLVPTALSPYVRHPTIAAMAMATLAECAPRRIAVALGMGNPMFLQESGVDAQRPARAVAEYMDCLRALWTGDPVHYQGEMLRLAGARLAFVPSAVPIYIAAIRPQMLRLAGRAADGVVLSAGLTPTFTRASLTTVAEAAREAGRDPARVWNASYVMAAASPDGRTAIEACRGKLAFLLRNKYLADNVRQAGVPIDQEAIMAAVARRDLEAARRFVSDDAVEAFSVCGTPGDVRKRLAVYAACGLQEIVLSITGPEEHRGLALEAARDFVA